MILSDPRLQRKKKKHSTSIDAQPKSRSAASTINQYVCKVCSFNHFLILSCFTFHHNMDLTHAASASLRRLWA